MIPDSTSRPIAPPPRTGRRRTVRPSRRRLGGAVLVLASLVAGPALAAPGGRIVATGVATTVEGASGGGIVPWATLAGYADRDQIGGTAWVTRVSPPDFRMDAFGATVSFSNRLELSFDRQRFDVDSVVPGETLEQEIFGVKARLAGDVLYTRLPQISVGALVKRNVTPEIPEAVGARDTSGVDAYLAASKVWLAGPFGRTAFANGVVRATRANQLGLLGFGGDREGGYSLVGEASAGLFLNRHWALGVEYRQKPDNLRFAREDDWYDVFVGWFPNKRVALVAAWSELGSISGLDDQGSLYLSLQLSQ